MKLEEMDAEKFTDLHKVIDLASTCSNSKQIKVYLSYFELFAKARHKNGGNLPPHVKNLVQQLQQKCDERPWPWHDSLSFKVVSTILLGLFVAYLAWKLGFSG
ncbi:MULTISPECIES: hypothetical protein [Pseudoalteromonas]|jgi:hypothetical protein|uniref:hypothetical protein n=1 Tax=Pseudoalteromonas TaxID=53246 RepID=UPI0002C9BFDE|nr:MULTISPECIES: hypothetical protein [Pseudoalteromonas]ENN99582.1 hypothetical protein J139_06982 [Pseudoalteromonas agarivorans S816]MDI3245787.1 hypothetical protein [Pseudoalteromonas agarivorans]TMS68851.1 hypothetical protein CWB83_04510 [Pseudoalteromonas sp. S1691]TMS69171.1 hypothetical protein CWB86_10490 [Pseudoalteromonas sp. S1731]TMS73792.1 hypothetical protein CWB88_09155 [Pseudoalteromonas sp. S1941]